MAKSEFVDQRALQVALCTVGCPSIALPKSQCSDSVTQSRLLMADAVADNARSFSTDMLPQAEQHTLAVQFAELARCLAGDTRWRHKCPENTQYSIAAAAATPEPKDAFAWYLTDRGAREMTPALHAEWREHRAEVREQYERVARADLARYELQCTDAALALESKAMCQHDTDTINVCGQHLTIGRRGDVYCLPSSTGDKVYTRYCETQHSLIIVYPNASVAWHSPSRSALPSQIPAPAQQHEQMGTEEPNHRQMFAVWSNWRWLYRFSQFGRFMEGDHDVVDTGIPEHLKRVQKKRKSNNEAHVCQYGHGKRVAYSMIPLIVLLMR